MTTKKMFYEIPTQVKFWDVDSNRYVGGIAINEYVICGYCGDIIDFSYIYEVTPADITPVVEFESWIDISHEIIRD